jgi:hypothetical protein
MDYDIVLQLGPGTVFVDGNEIGACPRVVVTQDRWPDVVIEDPLEADEIG